MNIKRYLSLTALFLTTIYSAFSQCVVAGTDFSTNSELCCPTLTSDAEEGGWYNEDLEWNKLCSTDMFTGPEYAKQKGVGGVFSVLGSNDMTNIDDVFHLNNLQADGSSTQYGYTTVTAQPKLVHSFCKANDASNNMLVNIGSAPYCPIMSYTVYGLTPGSTAEMSFSLSNLLDPTYFAHLDENVCQPDKDGKPGPQMGSFISKYNYASSSKTINGNKLGFGVVSSADGVSFNTSYNNALVQSSLTKATTGTADFGESTTLTHKVTVPETGTVTFYFYRETDCFQIPIGIDDIKVSGEIKPVLSSTGIPCPEQPLRIITKQDYPDKTTFSWKESKTSQTSSEKSFNFVPDAAETDYSVTLEVTLDGCKPSKSDPYPVHSGTCCTSAEGAPMAMTNLYYDDFGNFASDDTYEWTDRFGTTHTEKIPAGQVHTSQSHGSDIKIPYVKAYNVESSGAKLKVPLAGGTKTELYNQGVYVVSKYGGYPGGVKYDNSGTTTGGMLQFDLMQDGSQDEFFKIDIDHICTGKEVSFGAEFASISNHPGCIEVSLNYGNTVLESDQMSFSGGSEGWKGVNKKIKIDADKVGNAPEVTITMIVKHNKECADELCQRLHDNETRDYAIDNIIFQVCTPPDVNVESSVSTGKDILDLCTEDVLTLQSITSDAVKKFYLTSPGSKIGYVYQYTFDDPATESETKPIDWKTIHSEEVIEDDKFDVEVDKYWDAIFSELEDDVDHEKRIYFRVVVGEKSDLIADQSWKKNSAFSPCRKISISTIPVVAGLNCLDCEKVKKAEIISGDPETKVVLNATSGEKEVHLCPGEIAHLSTEDFEPTDPTVMDKNTPTIPRRYIASWHKGDKSAAGKPGIGYTSGDKNSKFDVTYEDADTYYLLVKDLDFPDAENCWVYDVVHVIANEAPKAELTSPEPFCEGTLKTEPDKSIDKTKYNVYWYETEADGNNDENAITEPVVKNVKAAEGEQEYYYVVEDKKTLCRGEAKLYTFSSNKADDLTLVNTLVSYRKNQEKIESLEKQLPTISEGMSTGYTLMWGLVKGADTEDTPDLKSATLEAAKTGYPTPTMKDKTNPLPEYLWYYVYQVSPDVCLSDTNLVKVEIIGAPTPKVKNGEFCSTETSNKLSDFAQIDAPDGNDSDYGLQFYEADGTTKITDPDMVPDISTPGEHVFYVSQISTSGGESAKKTITITSYGVRDVVTPSETSVYCKDEKGIANVEAFVTQGVDKQFYMSDADGLEIFKGKEPALNAQTLGGSSTMSVSSEAASITTYYVRNTYTITATSGSTMITNSSVCYGDHQEYKVEIQEVLPPTGTFNISYLKSEGASGGFKAPLTQDPSGVVASTGNTLVWYKDADLQNQIDEADATPTYNPSLVGNDEKTYYVTQKNAKGCESVAVQVKISVSGFPQPIVSPLDVCEGSDLLTGTLADKVTIKGTDVNDPEDFELVWYESKSDGTIDLTTESTTAPSLDPAIQKPENGQSKTVYTYYVLQRLKTDASASGAPASITVTVNAVPVLKVAAADPICGSKNESIDLADMYTENTKPSFSVQSEYLDEASSPVTNTKVSKRGTYQVQASYKLPSGETCVSESLPLKVFVHEVTPKIEGTETTCPGEAVELSSNVETEGAVLNDIKYYWSNNKSSVTGNEKTYNTGSAGLENSGNEMRVSLKVDAGACKGIEAPVQVIKVDIGQLDGTIEFSEKKNDTPKTPINVKTKDIIFTSCGSNVTVDVNVTATEDEFTYTKDGGSEKSGKFSSGSASLSLPAGKYEFRYINRCPTWFSFTIIDVSTKTEEVKRSDLDVCEGQKFNVEIKVTPNTTGYPYDIAWFKDETVISGESNNVYAIASTVPENSGVYSYEVKSGGCTTTAKVADGLPLTVKPYIKIDKSSLVRVYEEIRENPVVMNIPFIEPSDPSAIESDIIWTDERSSMVMSGSSASIPSLTSDHYFNINVSSEGYCDDSAAVKVLVDAKLQMEAELDVEEMCVGENHKITVDTTGTGRVLHKESGKFVLKVEEVVAGGTPSTIKLLPSGGKLSATISPKKDAQYTVTYSYVVGNQLITKPLSLKVHEAFDVQFSVNKSNVCEGESAEISVTKLYPEGTRLEWESNGEVLNMSDRGATVTPVFTLQDGFSQSKRYAVVATNDICMPKTYYPMVVVSKPIEGEIKAQDYICEGTKLKLDASSFKADKYTWYSDDQLGEGVKMEGSVITVLPVPDYAEYYLDMERGACKASVSHAAVVTYAPKLDYVDSLSFRDVEIVLQSGTGTEPFMFIIDGKDKADDVNSATKHDLEYGKHDLKIVDAAGCVVTEKFRINEPVIKIPVVLSPNGDGVGDIFKIEALKEAYPSAKVSIYDRWGKRVAYYKAADAEGWDGTYNGNPLPSTDYWYEVEIKELSKTYTGHFTLIRQ
ncbi:MAG: T9SS type B sorting domain-containing protein [Paludibacteraceae bacterium]|nr:T9SS type B sorting domain-containing protein [Paludibacteraceae bacterium]